jgi:hypothetical protein
MFRHAIPCLLANGDPTDRSMMLGFSMDLPPAMVRPYLNEFAQGAIGTDEQRMSAYQFLVAHELIDGHGLPFLHKGRQVSVNVPGFVVTAFPTNSTHSPQVYDLIDVAMRHIRTRNGPEALKAMLRANELEPDVPELRFNLAVAYGLAGNDQKQEQMLLDLYDDYPDYFFARTAMAGMQLRADDFNAARGLLAPLLARKQMHVSEFRSLCITSMKLELLSSNVGEAENWMLLWECAEPGHPEQAEWQSNIKRVRALMGQARPALIKRKKRR